MAVMKSPPGFVQVLSEALVDGLAKAGIAAEVETEAVPTTRLHRILVTARKFEKLRPSERQDLVWRIAEQALSPEQQLLISGIMTLTPRELRGD